jgi:hypothetical protein
VDNRHTGALVVIAFFGSWLHLIEWPDGLQKVTRHEKGITETPRRRITWSDCVVDVDVDSGVLDVYDYFLKLFFRPIRFCSGR